jgi:hypothetical protein
MTKREYDAVNSAYVSINMALGVLETLVRDKLVHEKKMKSKKFYPRGGLWLLENQAAKAYFHLEAIIISHKRKQKKRDRLGK